MPSLISTEIQQLSSAPIVGAAVSVPNKSGAMYALATGRKWIRKTKLSTSEFDMLAEALGWLLSRKLDLPIPNLAAYVPGEYEKDCWLSELIQNAGHWSADKTPIQNLKDMGGFLTLDALLMNADRHEGNILLEPRVENGEETWHLWGIDFGNATIGRINEFVSIRSDLPDTKVLPRDLPFEILEGPALQAAEEIKTWPASFINKSVHEACQVAGYERAGELAEVLEIRCNEAVSLTETYFKNILERL